jgi:hypothetical protein
MTTVTISTSLPYKDLTKENLCGENSVRAYVNDLTYNDGGNIDQGNPVSIDCEPEECDINTHIMLDGSDCKSTNIGAHCYLNDDTTGMCIKSSLFGACVYSCDTTTTDINTYENTFKSGIQELEKYWSTLKKGTDYIEIDTDKHADTDKPYAWTIAPNINTNTPICGPMCMDTCDPDSIGDDGFCLETHLNSNATDCCICNPQKWRDQPFIFTGGVKNTPYNFSEQFNAYQQDFKSDLHIQQKLKEIYNTDATGVVFKQINKGYYRPIKGPDGHFEDNLCVHPLIEPSDQLNPYLYNDQDGHDEYAFYMPMFRSILSRIGNPIREIQIPDTINPARFINSSQESYMKTVGYYEECFYGFKNTDDKCGSYGTFSCPDGMEKVDDNNIQSPRNPICKK